MNDIIAGPDWAPKVKVMNPIMVCIVYYAGAYRVTDSCTYAHVHKTHECVRA